MADRATIQKTIDAFIENNTQAVKQKNTNLLSAILAKDCIRMYRPLSFIQRYPQFFKPQITNADYEAQMQHELQTMQDVRQDVTRTVIDTTERKATLWVETTVFTTDSQNKVEVIFDLDFTEDGSQVKQVTEFVDTFESTKVLEQILTQMGAK
ncbi:hypothetical protein EKO27_g11442 [Xylaria grammica]|uniref:SnoaL-like domain-containing protein n=1 Tax=Xylaria grammica TaxID=363999 RepID=A0A439CNK9_9PEZI|nr:hypothetical protein F5X98DRAFT_327619 [Xylaria grammica]RWA03660.1 hypothetical protein EKO27_g11442 [Xylaria grammica]GAW14105.1 hypothetical protein ANO14919_034990 [Xylariales sp. No.14919]